MAYIYKITNKINQKKYIGKTEKVNPEERWKEHLRDAKREYRKNRALYRAINKYGAENFTFEIIEETDIPNEKEQYYIQFYDTYHNGYNETLGGDGASYLELPEQEICQYYLQNSLKATVKFFGHDKKTIQKVLYKNNIPLRESTERMLLATSYAVAQIDPNTNEIIHIFSSLSEAEKATGNTHHIADVIHGKRKTCKGYKWKKIE